jgi:hypothetical protein
MQPDNEKSWNVYPDTSSDPRFDGRAGNYLGSAGVTALWILGGLIGAGSIILALGISTQPGDNVLVIAACLISGTVGMIFLFALASIADALLFRTRQKAPTDDLAAPDA